MTAAPTGHTTVRTIRAGWILAALVFSLPLAGGCATVKPWQRETLADPIMQPGRNPIAAAQLDHVYVSREAACGGTTVVGGVLGENDATTQNRTPGVASIPIFGNLFKRKLITRQSTEILFFISPHIYRPDYQGHPTTSVVGSGNRSVSIPQPVPLGNPGSNTNAPAPQSQQQTPVQTAPANPVPTPGNRP